MQHHAPVKQADPMTPRSIRMVHASNMKTATTTSKASPCSQALLITITVNNNYTVHAIATTTLASTVVNNVEHGSVCMCKVTVATTSLCCHPALTASAPQQAKTRNITALKVVVTSQILTNMAILQLTDTNSSGNKSQQPSNALFPTNTSVQAPDATYYSPRPTHHYM